VVYCAATEVVEVAVGAELVGAIVDELDFVELDVAVEDELEVEVVVEVAIVVLVPWLELEELPEEVVVVEEELEVVEVDVEVVESDAAFFTITVPVM
jgi:hypothetical protein